ncbi:MAG: DNA polymerase III subunit gamma/tau [Verrucomicrobiota bacterium]
MSYRVFARKYRPQKFEEVIGQEHITRTLQNAIKGSRLAQAYLFVGPRGVGKTSTARILAKALNCQNGPTDNPCGTCDACIEIAEGRSLDVMEIDGASNNSVESIRTLRENAAYAPARGPYKVYLIDEVHMLTTAAFNALLKTLEEPPEHVKFLFATTEAQKVPATILSRCQRFDLRRLTPELIAGHLLYIAGEEKVDLDPAAAEAIARGADGALRDAESMFDQVIAFCGTSITAADVQMVFGFTPRERVITLGAALLDRDTPAALALVKDQSEAGKDLSRLLAELVGLLRDILIAKAHPTTGEPTDEARLGESISQEKLLVLLDHFGESEGRMRWATDKKLQLDVALIKGVHLLEETSLSDVIDALSALRGGTPLPDRVIPKVPALASLSTQTPRSIPTPPPVSVAPVQAASPAVTDATVSTAASPPPSPISPAAAESASSAEPSQPVSASEEEQALEDAPLLSMDGELPSAAVATDEKTDDLSLSDPWHKVAMSLASESPLKFGWLEDGHFVEIDGERLIVEFPPSLEAQTQTLFWIQAIKKIETMLSTDLGKKISLECRFSGAEPPAPEPEPVAPQKPKPVEKAPSSATSPASSSQSPAQAKAAESAPDISPEELEAFKNDPLIKKALEIFQAEILDGGKTA